MERLFENPLFFAMGCATWLPLIGLILMIVRGMIMGDLDAAIGVVAAGVCFGLGYLAMFPPHPSAPPIIFTAVLLSLVLLPSANHVAARKLSREIDLDVLEDAYLILGTRPRDAGARFRIAEAVARLGDYPLAAILGEAALTHVPTGLYLEERQMIASWKRYSEGKPVVSSLYCGLCGMQNVPNEFFCAKCGGQLVLNMFRKRWASSQAQAKIVATWLAAVFALVGIPMLTPVLNPRAALIATFAIAAASIGVAAWIWWPRKVAV